MKLPNDDSPWQQPIKPEAELHAKTTPTSSKTGGEEGSIEDDEELESSLRFLIQLEPDTN